MILLDFWDKKRKDIRMTERCQEFDMDGRQFLLQQAHGDRDTVRRSDLRRDPGEDPRPADTGLGHQEMQEFRSRGDSA